MCEHVVTPDYDMQYITVTIQSYESKDTIQSRASVLEAQPNIQNKT